MNILRTKTAEQSMKEAEEGEHQLKRSLSALDLIVFGIGIIVGTGIFVLTGIAAATDAGPAIVLSFVISGITCACAALCYAEFASTIPVAGSALYLRLCLARRVHRLDYWLGPVVGGNCRGLGGLGREIGFFCSALRHLW